MFYYVGDPGQFSSLPGKLLQLNCLGSEIFFISHWASFLKTFRRLPSANIVYFLKCPIVLWFLHASSALQHHVLHSLPPGQFLGQRLTVFWSLWPIVGMRWFLGTLDPEIYYRKPSWWPAAGGLAAALWFICSISPWSQRYFSSLQSESPGGAGCFIPSL